MLDFSAFQVRIIQWIRTAVDLQAILANQNAPAPKGGCYLSLDFSPIKKVGYDQAGPIDNAGLRKVWGDREFSVTINAFRTGAREAMEALQTSLELETVMDIFNAAGLIVVDSGPITDLTAAQGQTIVPRFMMEIFLRAPSEVEENINFFDKVHVVPSYNGAADEDEEFTVGLA